MTTHFPIFKDPPPSILVVKVEISQKNVFVVLVASNYVLFEKKFFFENFKFWGSKIAIFVSKVILFITGISDIISAIPQHTISLFIYTVFAIELRDFERLQKKYFYSKFVCQCYQFLTVLPISLSLYAKAHTSYNCLGTWPKLYIYVV